MKTKNSQCKLNNMSAMKQPANGNNRPGEHSAEQNK